MESLTAYMKKELMFYIKQEHDKGMPISHIKTALLRGGHNQDLIKEAMRSLKRNKYNLAKALTEPIKHDLDKVLYFNIINSLVKYIEYQLSVGRSMTEVKKILEKYGHSENVINAAIERINQTRPPINAYAKFIEIGLSVFLIVLTFIVAGLTEEPLGLILLGFSPIYLTIFVTILVVKNRRSTKRLWFLPVISNAALLGGLFLQFEPLEGMKLGNIIFFNMAYSLLYVAIVISQTQDLNKTMEELHEEVSPKRNSTESSIKTVKESDLKPKSKKTKTTKTQTSLKKSKTKK